MANTYVAFVDPAFTFEQRRALAQAIIKYIRDRSRQGRGIGNSPFRGPDGNNRYAKSYTTTGDFKAAGKTSGKVNLTLTGDMLESIEILDISLAGRIVIGYTEGFENDKSVWMREKGYDFLGLSQDELSRIVESMNFNGSGQTAPLSESVARGFLRALLGGR